jgi:hypothetical protein
MAKLPGWMKLEKMEPSTDGREVIVAISIHRWHPGWWWFVFRILLDKR